MQLLVTMGSLARTRGNVLCARRTTLRREVKKECKDGIETKVEPSTKKRKLKDKDSFQHGGCGPSTEGQLQHVLTEMIKVQSAPKPDLDVFSGNPLDYPFFKASFKEVVENVVEDQRGRLTRLIRYTTGSAKDLITHLIHANPESCYDEAVKMIDNEYGNPHLIHQSYIAQLRK